MKMATFVVAVLITCFDRGTAELVDEYATMWNDSMADLSAAPNPTLANTTVFHLYVIAFQVCRVGEFDTNCSYENLIDARP